MTQYIVRQISYLTGEMQYFNGYGYGYGKVIPRWSIKTSPFESLQLVVLPNYEEAYAVIKAHAGENDSIHSVEVHIP